MKSFLEFITEEKNNTDIEEDDVDQPTWRFNHELKPVVVVPHGYIEATRRHFQNDKEEYHKHWHHPFFGIIPHETDEANTTLKFMKNKEHDDFSHIKKTTPKAFDRLPNVNIKRFAGLSSNNLGDEMEKHNATNYGGFSHDVVIRKGTEKHGHTEKEYLNNMEKHDSGIEKHRQTTKDTHRLASPMNIKHI